MKRGKNLKRVICMVIDSMGIGAMPDCRELMIPKNVIL